ncbi:unnamed protein product [Cochlearia groenlandica]
MERTRSKPVRELPETIHSLVGFKSRLTSDWVKSVCNIVNNNVSSSSSEIIITSKPKEEEEEDSVFIDVQSIKEQLSTLTVQVNDQNKQRRQILNEFLDLKGNIRVFCRVKPLDSKNLKEAVASDARNVITNYAETKKKTYNFDRVFQPDSSQDDVFLEIEPIIKSVIDGYNACIFAYGQTGTGKTYTMEGCPETPGIVPRAIKGLFKQVDESNHRFVIKFSMLEIYMGSLRDLLVSQATKPIAPIPPSLVIHTDSKGEIDIENLVTIKVNDCNQVMKLYKLGCRNRATASTNSNSASSRSHCMIRVSITCVGATERRRETNKIWLVDLGGSERVSKTRATGLRFDEGRAINRSLSALGDVINSLQHKNSHIPYRNSKLTQVLQDSLGQDSKTLMLVHISPKEDDQFETICSLDFATRAKNIHLGKEETTEEQKKKESLMMNLRNMMEKIEQERDRALKDIRNLKETLEKVSGKPHVIEEEEEFEIREEIVQVTPKIQRNKSRRASDVFPSFMRPTASSNRRLSGSDFSVISNGPGTKSRRNSMVSVRAESVCLPVQKKKGFDSTCDSSERSVSKSTCAMLRQNTSDDAATVYSQDISECDIKLVVSEHKPKLVPESAAKPRSKIGIFDKIVSKKSEFSRVSSWLHSQSENRTFLQDKKQLLSRNRSFEKASSGIMSNEIYEKLEDIEENKTEETGNIKPTSMLKDLFELQCLCSSETEEEQILSKYSCPEVDDDYNDNESFYSPSLRYDGLSKHIDNMWFGADKSSEREQDSSAEMSLDQSQRVLSVAEDVVAPPTPLLGKQAIVVERGRGYRLVRKLKEIWLRLRVLMGLGFMGYGNDFFNGLTKET